MAYTKEQREAKKAQDEAKIRAEIEAQIRKEYEEKLKAQSEDLKSNAKTIQNNSRIPLDTIVPVVCNVDGGLYYESPKIRGYAIEWGGYKSVEYVELSELVTMKNAARRFFEDNWIVFEDTDEYTTGQLYDFLKVTKFYKNALTPETIDSIFDKTPAEIIKIVTHLSKGMKDTISTRVKIKIDSGELDSKGKIDAFEKALGVVFNL